MVDSAIGGVDYYIGGVLIGKTKADGTFDYKDGDVVTFKIGSITLGTVDSKNITDGILLPQDLAGVGRDKITDAKVVALARLLQTLDADNNPGNNIVIDETRLKDGLGNVVLDGTTDLSALFDAGVIVVSAIDAISHLRIATNDALTTDLESTPPATPSVTLTTDSGTASDKITNVGALDVGGIEAGAKVEYSTNGTTWSETKPTAVEGANTIQVRQMDAAGNVSPVATLSFTLDTTIATPTMALTTDSGTSTSDKITNDAALTFNSLAADVTRTFQVDGGAASSSYTAPTTDGAHTVVVTDTDTAGNTSNTSYTFTLDKIIAAPTAALTTDSGMSDSDKLTNDPALTISTPAADVTRTFRVNGELVDPNTYEGDDGDYTVVITDTDTAGNTASVTSTFTLDTTAPAITSAATATAINENSGAGQVAYTTTTDTAGVLYSLKDGGDKAAFTIDSATGAVTLVGNPDFEAKSSYTFTVQATDSAQNTSEKTVTLAINDVREQSVINGTAGDDTINHPTSLDDFTINALAGNDAITTGNGNDMVRAGEGIDTVHTGAGNDVIVVVGQTAANQYTQDAIINAGGTGIDLSGVITLADLNGRVTSEVVSGESIDGGTGTNRLIIYGNVDLSGVTLANVTQIQVNSTLTLTAQQLNTLPVRLMFGDGESVLNILNSGTDPVTVDLSGIGFIDFKTLNIGQGVTLIVDQSDVDSLHYITGDGALQASAASSTLALTGKYISLDVNNKDGVSDATHGGGIYVEGDILIGTESADTFNGSALGDRIEGGAGNDTLTGGDGNDIIRGGAGVDTMDGGAGDDKFVIVGDISGGGKIDSTADTDALGFPLTNLNGKNLNEDEDGAAEVIRGGDGDDTLYVYGTVDLSHYDLSGIEHVVTRSDVTATVAQLQSLQSWSGDGHSELRILSGPGSIDSGQPASLNLSTLRFESLGHIEIGSQVNVSAPDISYLGGATVLSGQGSLNSLNGNFNLSGITRTTSLDIRNADGGLALGGNLTENIISAWFSDGGSRYYKEGTLGNDVVNGGMYGDIIVGLAGADVLNGSAGDDILYGDEKRMYPFSIQNGQGGSGSGGSNILVNGLGGSAGFGEDYLYRNDDSSTGAIDVRSVFGEEGLNFFGHQFTSLYVNNNGNITFASPTGQFTPSVINGGVSNPIIAAFWADIDTRGGMVTPTPGGNSTGSDLVWYDLDAENGIFTATWDDVGYYSSRTDKLNAFQIQLIKTDGGDFDIVYRYEDVNWTTGNASGGSGGLGGSVARAGYSSGTTGGYYEMPQSGDQTAMLALDTTGPYTFSVKNGLTLEHSNNDQITGGSGNDIIIGGDGNHDVAIFSGALSEYRITPMGDAIKVSDSIYGRDGTDTIYSSTEYMHFSDGEVKTSSYFGANDTASEIFANANRLSLATAVDNTQVSDSSAIIDADLSGGGYYKLLFALSAASYVHNISGLGYTGSGSSSLLGSETTASDEAGRLKLNCYSYIAGDSCSLDFLSSSELGLSNEESTTQVSGNNFSYAFSGGFYVATDRNGIDASSVATLARSSDALFLTFRGTDSLGDGLDDFLAGDYSMTAHYARYQPLFNAIDNYLTSNPAITKVYVSGHSLGGEMANIYMYDHQPDQNNNIIYQSVTFEAANKAMPDSNDIRSINFEMRGDVVPDLGLATVGDISFGRTVNLDYENSPFITSHFMASIAPQFDSVANHLDGMDVLGFNERIYTDDNNDGVIETNTLVNGTELIAALVAAALPVVGSAVGLIVSEDGAEYINTGYNINTAWKDTQHNGTLVLNGFQSSLNSTYNLNEHDIGAVVVANDTFSLSENININASVADHGAILIGNDGNNKIVGSSFDDILIGSGDEDYLAGGDGNDYLYGSDYADIMNDVALNMRNYNLTSAGTGALQDNAGSDAVDDVSYLYGGKGNDVMRGGGDNDYFFVDITLSSAVADATNIDIINEFYVSGLSASANDWLVFSAAQLGIADQVHSFGFPTTSILDATGYMIPYVFPSGYEEHFFNVGHISEYTSGDGYLNDVDDFTWPNPDDSADSFFAFILENTTGNLYFDLDGNGDYGDQTLIANIGASSSFGSDNLADMHANQILLVDNFDFFNTYVGSSVIA